MTTLDWILLAALILVLYQYGKLLDKQKKRDIEDAVNQHRDFIARNST